MIFKTSFKGNLVLIIRLNWYKKLDNYLKIESSSKNGRLYLKTKK